jgi:hypothetical protein
MYLVVAGVKKRAECSQNSCVRRNRMKQTRAKSRVLQFRLSVKDVKPEIWRKLLVSSDVTLARLHAVLQVLMGWSDRHLYAFVINEKRYSSPSEDDDVKRDNMIGTKLSSVFAKNARVITYEYDFGDGWEIELSNEVKSDSLEENEWVECLEGSRHGPVEDSGGYRGYMEKAKIYGNPQHRRYQEIRKLIGPKFDPEAFDLRQTNEMLKKIS